MNTNPPTDIHQAIRYFNEGDLANAGRLAQELFGQNPRDAEAIHLLGLIASRAERNELAVKLLEMAIDLKPNSAVFHFHLGELYAKQQKTRHAEKQYRRAIDLKPDFVNAFVNLGNIYVGNGDPESAIEAYLTATRLNPKTESAFHNLGILAQERGEHLAALQFFDQAIQAAPQAALSHTARGFSLLMLGRFQEGWSTYEWRWHLPNNAPRICHQPRWDGTQPQGQRIYLYTEQGFGDALMFVRYVPLVEKLGATVILECKPEMTRLFQSSHLAHKQVTRAQNDSNPPDFDFDCHLPILSLPGFFSPSLSTIPTEVPYLHPDPVLVAQWHDRLKTLPGLRVALSWSGNPETSVNRHRACTFQLFKSLVPITGVSFVSVQKGPPVQQLQDDPDAGMVVNLDPQLTDFAETAAVLAQCDLLISTDTAVVHLAGAMGKPVWTLLHSASEWRWMQERLDSPWYPSMRLFRQQTPEDWPELLKRVKEELLLWVGSNKGYRPPSPD